MKMRNHLKKVLKAISIAILAVVLAFTNFAGLFPAKVYAAPQVVDNYDEFEYYMHNASTNPDNPTVIKLGHDFQIPNDKAANVNDNKYVILDLNGQTLRLDGCINVRGSLTVQGSGTLKCNAPIIIYGGTFTLSGGTLARNGYTNGVVIHSGSKFVMTGGEINGEGPNPFVSSEEDATIEISGGTITKNSGPNAAISSAGTVSITGGTITKKDGPGATISSAGTMSITGGTITNTCRNGYTVSVTSHGTLTVSGGTLQNTEGGYSLSIENGGQATQTGGTISGSIDTNSNGTFNYEGGTNPEHSTITFVANGGSGTMDPQYVQNGVATALTANSFTRDDYSFDGWKDGSGTSYADGATVNINSDMTLTAQWKESSAPTTYTITFDANGGTVSPTSGTTDASGKLSSLPTPTWSGHDFSGWFTAANGGTQVTTNTVFTGNDTIYAHWAETPATYTITFDANGGTVSPTSGTTDASGKLSSLPTPTWSGHDFSGWFTAANGGTQVTTNTVFTGNDTIYAHWAGTPSYHTVTYHVVNGKWNDTNTSGDRTETVANGQHPAHVPPVGSKPNAGYKAGSWDTNPSSATITGNTTFTYTYATNTSPSSSSKKSDDSDHHEESSSPSPEKPSWTPAKAAATIAAQKAQKQQAAASQLASIQTMLRTKTSDRAGTGRNVIDLDMTKVDILDPATVNLLLLNNRFAFNVKISVPGGLTTTIMIPANFNFRPFIKADGTINIH